jgi:hypothetical protein
MAAAAEFPVLAMYASGPNAANTLEQFANQPVEKLGETLWREAQTRLENIETLRGELDSYEPLANKQILQLVLGKPDLRPWQKKVGRDFAAAVQDKAESNKMFWQMIAIGIGLIAALPTGGSSAAIAITAVAAISGAAVATYNAYEAWQQYRVEKAGAKTDLDKARNISKEEPSFFWVAVEIIGAGLELGAAAAAFKSVVKVIKEAKHTRDVLKMAEAIEAAAPPASRSAITARAAGEVGPEAVAEMIVAEGRKFRSGDLAKIKASLEQSALEGWTEAYDAMAANNKIRPLTEEALHAELARIPAKEPHRFRNPAASTRSRTSLLTRWCMPARRGWASSSTDSGPSSKRCPPRSGSFARWIGRASAARSGQRWPGCGRRAMRISRTTSPGTTAIRSRRT